MFHSGVSYFLSDKFTKCDCNLLSYVLWLSNVRLILSQVQFGTVILIILYFVEEVKSSKILRNWNKQISRISDSLSTSY